MNDEVRAAIRRLIGKPCCRQRVSSPRSLSFGFGDKVYHGNPRLADSFYGEWEIGTYYCAWRVVKEKRLLCGSSDSVDSVAELNATLSQICLGAITAVDQISDFDVRVEFENGTTVEFLT